MLVNEIQFANYWLVNANVLWSFLQVITVKQSRLNVNFSFILGITSN